MLTCAGYDDSIRWRPGERLEQLFERRCDWLREHGWARHLAVDALDGSLSYTELDARANQLARFLIRRGVRPGDRLGLLSDVAVDGYVGMLAALKAHAAFVPLDAGFPADRVSYIVADAGVRVVLTRAHLAGRVAGPGGAALLDVDEAADLIAGQSPGRLAPAEAGEPVDELCYIIYTSGSTGRPKGVAVGHASICNFVRVAAEVYGITHDDRVYQGMTIAFDFSVEEIWVPWMCCATLVPKPDGDRLLGRDLHTFLRDRQVTALCCVPTLLATLEEDLPELRFLLVSGESCPRDLVARWHRPGRRFLNVYGPTEATVTATWTVVHPGRPVTIGVPLPTYSVVILDPDSGTALPPGAMGEIGIAGIGLAHGYLNRPDLTERAFVPDFLGIPDNPPGRIYRTGDLGRVNAEGEIEHHGRIDTQVKIRGYRIELTEIESVLLRAPGIAQAVVSTYRPEPDVVELVAYYSPRRDAPAVDADRVYAELRDQLPGYMVPAYLEQVPVIPMLPSGKADRASLPAPSGPRHLAAPGDRAAPATNTERELAEVLAGVLGVERVPVDGHFFDELGASSLLMARFSAAIRERPNLPPVCLKDIYLHPTVRDLAAAVAQPGPAREPALTALPHTARPGHRQAAVFPVRRAAAAGLPRLSRRRFCGGGRRVLVDDGGPRGARDLPPPGGLRRGQAAGPGDLAGRRQVDAHRPLEAAPHPGLEPRLRPVLDRQDDGRRQSDGAAVRRHPAVRPVPAGARRQDRPRGGDLHAARAGLHRPADDRRGQRDPQGHVPQRLPRPGRRDRDRRDHRRPRRLRRRADGHRHRHRGRRRGAARARVRPARRAGGPGRRVLARLPGPARRGRLGLPDRPARPLRRGAPGRRTAPPGCCSRWPWPGRSRRPRPACWCPVPRCWAGRSGRWRYRGRPVLRGGGHRGGRVLRRRGGRAGHRRHRSPAAEPGPETGPGVPPVRVAPRAAARRLPAVEHPVLHRPVR